uniref:C2 domain-containing protein n=1 Tax=Parastrongyloides trichosuri TaxID=131310 RepID=A0A0N4ZWT8_PARTI
MNNEKCKSCYHDKTEKVKKLDEKETLYCSVAAAIVGCSATVKGIGKNNVKKENGKNTMKEEFNFLMKVFEQEYNTKCVFELIERNELTIEIFVKTLYPQLFVFTVDRKIKNSNIQYVNQTIESNTLQTITVLEEPNLSFRMYRRNNVNSNSDNEYHINKTFQKSAKLFRRLTRSNDKNGLCLSIDMKSFKLNTMHNISLLGIDAVADVKIRRKNCFGCDEIVFGLEELKDVINRMFMYSFSIYRFDNDIELLRTNLTIANFILQCITEYYGIIPLTMRLLVLSKMFDLELFGDFLNIKEKIVIYNCEVIKGACLLTTPKALKALYILGDSIVSYFQSVIEINGDSFFYPPESETAGVIEFTKLAQIITIILQAKIWDNPVAGVYVIKIQNIITESIEKNIFEWFSRKFININNQLTHVDYLCSIVDQIYLSISTNYLTLTNILNSFHMNYTNIVFKMINERLNVLIRSSITNAVDELDSRDNNNLEIFTRSTMKLLDALRQLRVLQKNLGYTDVLQYEDYFETTSVFWTFTWSNMSKELIYKALQPQHNEKRQHSDSTASVISLQSNKGLDYPCFDSAIYCLAIWKALADDYVRLQITNVFSENLRLYSKEICREARLKNNAIFYLKSANSIEHVISQIMQNYPRFIEMDRLKTLLSEEEYFNVCSTISKVTAATQSVCYKFAEDLIILFLSKKKDILKNLCKNLSSQGVKREKNNFKTFVKSFLNHEGMENLLYYLEKIYNLIDCNLSTRLREYALERLWDLTESYIKDSLCKGQPVKYYEQMESACFHISHVLKIIWDIENSQLYKELRINKTSTEDLILQYYSRLGDRTLNSLVNSKTQTLTLRIGYIPMSGQQILLSMLIIRANNVPILDTFSKSSDPYVRIELMPRCLFPLHSYPASSTEIRQRTLNPRWNQHFNMTIAENKFFINGACLRISILDHDVVLYNDIAGEAYIPLSTISKISGSEIKNLPNQIVLPILPLSYNQYGIEFMILKDRSLHDIEAKNFCDYELYIKNYHMLPPTSNDDKEFRYEAIKTFDKKKKQIKTAIKNVF